MQIQPNRLPNAAPVAAQAAAPETAPPTEDSVAQDARYTPSTRWLQLVDHLHDQPEVREERVQAVLERLQSGYYSSVESISLTAQAILRAQD